MPKSIAYRLLEPALAAAANVRLICHEGKLTDLLGQLAVQRLDLVLADEPLGRQAGMKAFNHALGSTAMSFFATPELKRSLKGAFPQCLDDAPMLLPGNASAMRQRFDLWLASHKIRPRVIGEFDDAALMKAFGGEGRGVFMTPAVLESETAAQYGVRVVGRSDELVEEFHAISTERRITHPCVAAITSSARGPVLRGVTRLGAGCVGSTQATSSGGSAGSMSRLTATACPSLRTSTHSSVSVALALISWCGTNGGT